MSYKSENWKDKLDEVRAFNKKDEILKEEAPQVEEEIELLLQELDETPEVTEGKSLSLDQIKKKYKRDISKLNGQMPKYRSPLELALLRHAYDHGLIKTDNPDHADQVIDGLLDDMDEGAVKEEVEEKVSVEKTVEKLTEKNMLGRLAKQLRLTEEGKQMMFDYFENGSLKQ
jgi:hypothetical protein